MLALSLPRDGSRWIVVDHAGERLRISVRADRQHGGIQVAFDGPRSFLVLREELADRDR